VLVSSCGFFVFGMSVAYFFVFPVAFGFFAGYTPAGVQMMTDIDKYLSFVLTMFIAFGITFETPIIVVVLVRMRVVSLEKLKSVRPDVISQSLLAVPLWLLFELGLLLARFVAAPLPAAGTEGTEPAK
jgi:sec-independent protein translocase protein TatC